MNSGTAEKPPKVVLDTNVVVSALIYGGKPEQIYNLVLNKQIFAITSSILLAELIETLIKKFNFDLNRIQQLEKIIKRNFHTVHPKKTIKLQYDEDDNRVLEAAFEGNCDYIVTGDKELLELSIYNASRYKTRSDEIASDYKHIKIVTADRFLNSLP